MIACDSYSDYNNANIYKTESKRVKQTAGSFLINVIPYLANDDLNFSCASLAARASSSS